MQYEIEYSVTKTMVVEADQVDIGMADEDQLSSRFHQAIEDEDDHNMNNYQFIGYREMN